MIGCQKYADIVAKSYGDDLPGFTFIGSGCSRRAYLGPDGVIYKRAWSNEDNIREYENALRLMNIPCKGIEIPAVSLWNCDGKAVLAMEYIDGDRHCLGHAMYERIWKTWQIVDTHSGNVVKARCGTVFLIDIAS